MQPAQLREIQEDGIVFGNTVWQLSPAGKFHIVTVQCASTLNTISLIVN
jgi:hypothetical protein